MPLVTFAIKDRSKEIRRQDGINKNLKPQDPVPRVPNQIPKLDGGSP